MQSVGSQNSSYVNIGIGGAGINITLEYIQQQLDFFEIGRDGLRRPGSGALSAFEETQLRKCFFEKEVGRSGELRYFSNSFFLDTNSESFDRVFYSPLREVVDFANVITRNIDMQGVQMARGECREMMCNDFQTRFNQFQGMTEEHVIGINRVSSSYGAASCSININFIELSDSYQIYQHNYVIPDLARDALSPADIYNMILGYSPTEETTYSFQFQNSALQRRLDGLYVQVPPRGFDQLNRLLAQSIFDLNSPFFSRASSNTSMRKFATNMVPFPRLSQFIVNAYDSQYDQKYDQKTLEDKLLLGLQNHNNCLMSDVDLFAQKQTHSEKIFMSTFLTKGDVSEIAFIEKSQQYIKRFLTNRIYHMGGESMNFSYCFCDASDLRAFFVACDSSYASYLQKLSHIYSNLYRRKVFLHSFCSKEIDEMEFIEQESNLNDLCAEYEMIRGTQNEYGAYAEDYDE